MYLIKLIFSSFKTHTYAIAAIIIYSAVRGSEIINLHFYFPIRQNADFGQNCLPISTVFVCNLGGKILHIYTRWKTVRSIYMPIPLFSDHLSMDFGDSRHLFPAYLLPVYCCFQFFFCRCCADPVLQGCVSNDLLAHLKKLLNKNMLAFLKSSNQVLKGQLISERWVQRLPAWKCQPPTQFGSANNWQMVWLYRALQKK